MHRIPRKDMPKPGDVFYSVAAFIGGWDCGGYAGSEEGAWDLLCNWVENTGEDVSGNGDLHYTIPSGAAITRHVYG